MPMSPRILLTSGVRGDTRRYRALHLYEQLLLAGIDAQYYHLTDPKLLKAASQESWDWVILHRVAYSDYIRQVLESVHSRSLICSDFDDLIFDPSVFAFINSPDFVDPVRAAMYQENMRNIRKVLDQSMVALASTDFLAGEIRKTGKSVWVHRNAFSFEMEAIARRVRESANKRHDPRKVVIGYASGTATHNRDFELITPALQSVMQRYPQTELWLIGPLDLNEQWKPMQERIRRFNLVPWRDLPDLLASFDINLAPLVTDNPFAQSKSEIKFMEAGMVGVPTAASNTDAFSYAIRSGETGFLCSNEAEWVAALSQMVEDKQLRDRVGRQALEFIQTAYHPITRTHQLVNSLDEINRQMGRADFWGGEQPSLVEIQRRSQVYRAEDQRKISRYEKDPTNIQLGVYSLRNLGVRKTLHQVKLYFRRILSPIFPFKKSA